MSGRMLKEELPPLKSCLSCTERLCWRRWGLLYMDDVSNAYSNAIVADKLQGEKITYQVPRIEARFIGSDGKVYLFGMLACEKEKKPQWESNWKQAKLYIHHAGKDAVMQAFDEHIR